MSQTDAVSLLLVIAAAVGAVLLTDSLRRLRVPLVIVEIGVGMILGPQGLGLVQMTRLVTVAAQIGVTCLFFMIGYEIRLSRLRGRPLTLGIAGWCLSFAVGSGAALVLRLSGAHNAVIPLGLSLSTTAPILFLPFLRDVGVVRSRLGPYLVAAGTVAQFAPAACIALLLRDSLVATSLILVLCLAIATAGVWLPDRLVLRRVPAYVGELTPSVWALALAALAYLTALLGLGGLPTALALGLLARRLVPADARPAVRSRLCLAGFGLFVPIFPIAAGVRFDARALTASPMTLVAVLLTALAFLLVRFASAALYSSVLSLRESLALTSFSATPLPLVVIITTAAVRAGSMTTFTGTVLVAAAMLSMLAFPALGLRLAPSESQGVSEPRHGGSPAPAFASSLAALTAAVPENASKEER